VLRAARPALRTALLALVAGLTVTVPAAPAAAVVLPPGFTQVDVVTGGLATPTAFARTPDGRVLVAEKRGRVRIAPAGSSTASILALDINTKVNSFSDRGLLGLAVDSAFATNKYVYLLYTVELSPSTPDTETPSVSRLTRVVLNDNNTFGPEIVILGKEDGGQPCAPHPSNDTDCMPADYKWHVIGTVISAPDGSLYVGSGDSHAQATPDDTTFRPFDETNTVGKILRVDRDGNGLPGHPFCPTETDLTRTCTKVYAKGFRNPFRFTLRPGGGLVVGDVGSSYAEELNLVQPGRNYGWPCYEGARYDAAWNVTLHRTNPRAETHPTCQALFAKAGTADGATPPNWSYDHGTGASITAGPVYTGGAYPDEWVGDVFVGDYVRGEVTRLELTGDDRVAAVHPFATEWGTGVQLSLNPAGELEFLDIFATSADPIGVHKFGYQAVNRVPVVQASATPTSGGAPPLDVQFSSAGTSDPDGDPLTYSWDFGDGTPPSAAPNPLHTYTANGTFSAVLTVDDGTGRPQTRQLTIQVGQNLPPTATIVSPAAGELFTAGDRVDVSGTGSDGEDAAPPALSWRIVLVHGTHQHEVATFEGGEGSFVALDDHDADSYYLLELTARDTRGLTSTTTRRMDPRTVQLTLDSHPDGAPVLYGDTGVRPAPFTRTAATGHLTQVSAAERWTDPAGQEWVFAGWSDRGARQHDLRVPIGSDRLTASYRPAGPVETLVVAASEDTWIDSSAAGADVPHGDDPRLRVDAGSATAATPQQTLLRFPVTGVGCRTVVAARLRMTQVANDSSPRAGRVHRVNGPWDETTTWNTPGRATLDPTVLGEFARAESGETHEIPLTGFTPGDGVVDLGLDSVDFDGAGWSSSETASPPQLVLDVVAAVALATPGGATPTGFGSQDGIVRTTGGRLLSVHARSAGGLQLTSGDGGCGQSTQTRGATATGVIGSGNPTGSLLLVPAAGSVPQHAWLAYSAEPGSTSGTSLRIRRLDDLDNPLGPVVGPERVLDSLRYGTLRPDLALAGSGSTARVVVVWTRRTTARSWSIATAELSNTTAAGAAVGPLTVIRSGTGRPRAASVVGLPDGGVRILAPASDGSIHAYRSGATETAWTKGPFVSSSAADAAPAAVRLPDGSVLAAVDGATGSVRVVQVTPAGTSATRELDVSGLVQPTLVLTDAGPLLLAVRVRDGAVVSRLRSAGVWAAGDRVELDGVTATPHARPTAVAGGGRVVVLVSAPTAATPGRRATVWSRAG
jgi:glucose/arabinose dehydrogenase